MAQNKFHPNLCLLLLVSGDTPYRVDAQQINQRASLLQRYLCDEQKELQALYALQALMVHMEQPASECRRLETFRGGQNIKYLTVQYMLLRFC